MQRRVGRGSRTLELLRDALQLLLEPGLCVRGQLLAPADVLEHPKEACSLADAIAQAFLSLCAKCLQILRGYRGEDV